MTGGPVTVWRWRDAFQREFQARMDWCVKSEEGANHPPVAVLNGDESSRALEIEAAAGQRVELSAEGSRDPDGDDLSYRWWVYREAGTYGGDVPIEGACHARAVVAVPRDAGNATIHVILEVTDSGPPPITRYRRAIIGAGLTPQPRR